MQARLLIKSIGGFSSKMLINSGVLIYLEKNVLLISTQVNRQRMSNRDQVVNCVRQGGLLSPFLFNVYVNELSVLLKKSGIVGI